MPPAGYRAVTETEIKKSRFLTTLARTNTEAEARAMVAEVRSAYADARHHCLAYIVDDEGARMAHSSDDGEPAGTAGIPMLSALTQADLVNVTAVVTRYFGGIKLGASGLTRAYAGSVSTAVAAMPRVRRQVSPIWSVRVPYNDLGRIQEELIRGGATVIEAIYDDADVRLRLTIPDDPTGLVARATQGTMTPVLDGQDVTELSVGSATLTAR
ncbi:MAG: IMPACT family protein [Propionibacteriaceae bacterium]|jgi:uncharacterized YigZ family protein|nr:IMPACT family protein [Propionibacteriaceae bacterium]